MKDFDIEQIMSIRALERDRLDLYEEIQADYKDLIDSLSYILDAFEGDIGYKHYIGNAVKSYKKEWKKLNKKVKKLDAQIKDVVRR